MRVDQPKPPEESPKGSHFFLEIKLLFIKLLGLKITKQCLFWCKNHIIMLESEKMEDNKNALDEVNNGCTIGIEAIKRLIDKVEDKEFKKLLEKELKQYDKIEDKIHDIYNKYSDKDPHEIGLVMKTMNDYMTNIKTMMDHSDSKIAEMLLQGTNMGIIEGKKILNNKKIDKEVEDLLKEFVNDQEKIIEELKKYL